MATPIGTLGTIPTITIGGRVFTDLTTLKILGARTQGTSKSTYRVGGASSGYQVTLGTTLTIRAVTFMNVATAGEATILYSDNDVGMNGSTAFTNPVYFLGGTTAAFPTSAAGSLQVATSFAVPSQKYFGLLSISGDYGSLAYGYET